MSDAKPRRQVAVVLHAHLPYVREEEAFHPCERWFHEAVWECYLPLIAMLDRLANDRIASPITISVSPPLSAMLTDTVMQQRFERHLDALEELSRDQLRHPQHGGAFIAAAEHHQQTLEAARAVWNRWKGNLLRALHTHERSGRIQLMTTTISHAYLPGLLPLDSAIDAQITLGQAHFRSRSLQSCGIWLPECAYAPGTDELLARHGIGHTVVDTHAIQPPAGGPRMPKAVRSERDVIYFPRDRQSARQIWSREHGYPGHPSYRDFYRDLGNDLDAKSLGPFEVGSMTGLKYFRITDQTAKKQPYIPSAAHQLALGHAEHFVASLRKPAPSNDIAVAAFDAELFGHWWHEGPQFLEQVLRQIAHLPDLHAVTLAEAARNPNIGRIAEPHQSSWGEGGYSKVWIGQRTAPLWRAIHRTHREVVDAIHAHRSKQAGTLVALDRAIAELLLLEASDWLFMIHENECADYARKRLADHLEAAQQFTALAKSMNNEPSSERDFRTEKPHPLLQHLSSSTVHRALAPTKPYSHRDMTPHRVPIAS